MNVMAKTFGALAAASMLLAQPAVAAVRSADSLPSVSSDVLVDRAASPARRAEAAEGGGILLPLIIGGSILIAVILVVAGDSSESDSPG